MSLNSDQRPPTPYEVVMGALTRSYDMPDPGTPEHTQVVNRVQSTLRRFQGAKVEVYVPVFALRDLKPELPALGLRLKPAEASKQRLS